MSKKIAPFGSWSSPLEVERLLASGISFSELQCDDGKLYYLEHRAQEKGRTSLLQGTHEIVHSPFNVKTRVHEYGGGDFRVKDGTIIFSDDKEKALYIIEQDSFPRKIFENENLRFADFSINTKGRFCIAVCEDHTKEGFPENKLVRISFDGEIKDVLRGNDFYAHPRLSPDGNKLAWIAWDRPNMPWEETLIGFADLEGVILNNIDYNGSSKGVTFQFPAWLDNDRCLFISDQTGWSNLYIRKDRKVSSLTEQEEEFGAPLWKLGGSRYVAMPGKIAAISTVNGVDHLNFIENGICTKQILPFTSIRNLAYNGEEIFFIGASPEMVASLIAMDPLSLAWKVIKPSSEVTCDSDSLSLPEAVTFPSEAGSTHAFFYAPRNKKYEGEEGTFPPCIFKCHGGPTAHVAPTLSLEVQFWTTRGFAYCDVNYSGSTGYGTPYRKRLDGNWGHLDVLDVVNAAKFLSGTNRVDPEKMIVKGGSAGGFIAMAAATFYDTFNVATAYYGVSDLELLEKDSHKFEKWYGIHLIGPYPEEKEKYIERSPVHYTDRLKTPMLIFQGDEDKVVLPEQSDKFYKSLLQKGVPVSYTLMKGEGHGFRKSESKKTALYAELNFYSKVLNIPMDPDLPEYPIDNLPE